MLFRILDQIKIYFAINIIWKVFPSKKEQTISIFEATEDDSAWQLLYGIKLVNRPEEKAELFLQGMEEAHHAELFRDLIKKEFGKKFCKFCSEKKLLYSQKEDSWRLPVYCLIGEKSAATRFQNIVDVCPEGELKKTLKKIVADEVGHIHKAEEQIKVDGKTEQEINKEIKKIKRKRFIESWLRSGREITGILTSLILLIIYFSVGWIFSGYLFLTQFKNKNKNKNKKNNEIMYQVKEEHV